MNKAIVLMSAVALLLLYGYADPVGCSEPSADEKPATSKQKRALRSGGFCRITGALIKPAGCAAYGFIDGEKIEVGGEMLRHPIFAGQPIRTQHILLLEIADPPSFYKALLGPKFDSTDQALAYLVNSSVRVFVRSGWAYLIGEQVAVETEYTNAGAEGSAIALQIIKDNAGEKHRFYFLRGTRASVRPKDATEPTILETPGTFVDVTSRRSVSKPRKFDENDSFIRDLKAVAEAAMLAWEKE